MKSIRKNLNFIISTLLLVLISAFCIRGTVMSQEKHADKEEARYYRQMEKEYVDRVRSLLTQQGYRNSGVTMIYTVTEEGSREYTVQLHHKKLSALNEDGRERVLSACQELIFPAKDCSFCYEVLSYADL